MPEPAKVVRARIAALGDGVLVGTSVEQSPGVWVPKLTYFSPGGDERWDLDVDIGDATALHLEDMVTAETEDAVTLVGRLDPGAGQVTEAWISTIDVTGVMTEVKQLADAGSPLVTYAVTNVDDGIVIGGRAGDRGWLAKLGPTHEFVWEQRFDYEEATAILDVGALADGRIASVGTTTLTEQGSDGQPLVRSFVRVHQASGELESHRLLPVDIGEDSLEARAVQEYDDDIVVGGARYFGPDTTAYLWRLDPQLDTVETTVVGEGGFSGISGLVATPEGSLLAAGHESASIPPVQAVRVVTHDPTIVEWSFRGEQGVLSSIALSTTEPAIYVGGVDQANSTTPLTVCKISR